MKRDSIADKDNIQPATSGLTQKIQNKYKDHEGPTFNWDTEQTTSGAQ